MIRLLSSCLVICSLLTLVTAGYTEETVRLASGEWPPYQSKELKHAGVVSRIVTEAFAQSDIRVELGYFPWKRSYHYAETGQWDGTFVWFETPERRELFYVSDPVIDINYVFFHKKEFPFEWKTIADLKPLIIGGTLGYEYGTAFQGAEKDGVIRVVRKPTDAENFQRLLEGQIHIFPCDVEVGYELIWKHFTPNEVQRFTHHPLPVRAAPHHLLLSKRIERNKRLMVLFNKGLRQIKESGQYDQFITESRRGDYHR